MTGLSDQFQRPINYLRISVTDRCNLRCVYCMPPEGIPLLSHDDVLRYEEIYTVAKAAAELGINRIRVTGGEPLVRAKLPSLIAMLASIKGVADLSLTTNGVLLEKYACELKQAGLKRINVSLDSLRPDRFKKITRTNTLDEVLKGINAARAMGLDPVKINTVVIGGLNDDEILDFARLTLQGEWHVRFIEYMPFAGSNPSTRLVTVSEIRKKITELGPLDPVLRKDGGPAKYYKFAGAPGTIGFISPVSDHFCEMCNRLRLTADGKLRPCLFSDKEIDVRDPLRKGASEVDLRNLILQAVFSKPRGHRLESGITCNRLMAQIGG